MRLLSLLFVLLLTMPACAGMQRYSTGIPATASEKFFFHMQKEAEERGYTVSKSDSLSIDVNDGFLQYSIFDDEISLVITVKGAKGMSDEEIAAKQANLKALSDDLVEKARARSEAANAFE